MAISELLAFAETTLFGDTTKTGHFESVEKEHFGAIWVNQIL